VTESLRSPSMPKAQFGYPLAASLLPWVDKDMGNGQSREEWKAQVEANKILGRNGAQIPIDGVCVRVGAMRCHSQALTIKLRRPLPLDEIEGMLAEANDWVKVVPNRREESLAELTPAAVSGKLSVPVGRLRKMPMARSTSPPLPWVTSSSGALPSPPAHAAHPAGGWGEALRKLRKPLNLQP